MLKAAVLLATNAIPRALAAAAQRRSASICSSRVSPAKKFALLEKSGFNEKLLQQFAANVRAQDLPPHIVREILLAGKRCAASYFFEASAKKGDVLDGHKIDLLLDLPGLCFFQGESEFREIPTPSERAIRILLGHAQLTPQALAKLAVDKDSAMAIIATKCDDVLESEVVAQCAGFAAGFRPADVKCFCSAPFVYTTDDGTTISEIDLIALRTMAQNPRQIEKILQRLAA